MDLSSNRYMSLSFCEMRLDHKPDKLCLSGSGLPMPADGSSERSISFSSLQRALCSFLSFSRIFSYASQVLPSNTSDLIHLLIIRYVSLATAVSIEGGRNLLHQILILKNMQCFLFSFPVLSTHDHECFSSTTRHLERFVSANNLLYKAFQVVSELVYTDYIHNLTITYGNSVQLYRNSPNKAKHSNSFFVAALPSLQSCACWQR